MPFQDLNVGSSSVFVSGVPEIRSPTDFQYASNTPASGSESSGGFFSSIILGLGGAALGAARTISGSGDSADQPNGTSANISTAQVDGQTGFINSLSGQVSGVLKAIGSVGDGLQGIAQEYEQARDSFGGSSSSTPTTPTLISYGENGASMNLNLAVIGAVIAVAGVIYVATKD